MHFQVNAPFLPGEIHARTLHSDVLEATGRMAPTECELTPGQLRSELQERIDAIEKNAVLRE
eukprot:4701446-Prorocentrum_lima.AAC.1